MTTAASVVAGFAELTKLNPGVAQEVMADIDPITWMAVRAFLKTEKLEPLEFKDHMPMLDIYRDWHPMIVGQKGSQIGMTTAQICKLLFYADTHNITAIYTMPTARDVFEFSQARFSPVIKASTYLQARMGNVDNAQLKRMGASTLYFRGAQKQSQAISVPADIIINDEYDFSNQDIMDTFEKRVGASRLKWFWRFSTPTLPDYGINALYKQTDQRHWLVKCSSCGRWQDILFEHNLMHRRHSRPFFGCRRCKTRLHRRNGMWVAKYPSRATDQVFDDSGKLIHEAEGMRGYWINPLTFTFKTARDVAGEWNKVEKKNTSFAKKRFANFDLGLPYLSGEGVLSRDTFIRTMSTESGTGSGFTVIGVDQGDTLHYVIKRFLPSGRSATIDFGTTESFFFIDTLLDHYQCRAGIIDALPNKHNARDLVHRHPHRLYMAYYKDQDRDKKEVTENKRKEKEEAKKKIATETGVVYLDRTESLDFSGDRWIHGQSYMVGNLSMGFSEEMEEFFKQMCNMLRDLVEDPSGNVKAVWVKTGADHFRHADNYAEYAASMYGKGDISDLSVGGNISELALPNMGRVSINDLVPQGMNIRSTFGRWPT